MRRVEPLDWKFEWKRTLCSASFYWLSMNFLSCRACYGVLRFIMESGAKGCEVRYQNSYKKISALVFLSGLLEGCPFRLVKIWLVSQQVIVSGKLRAQRAKSMKFKDGYMISSGSPVNEYIDSAVRHVLLRQVCWVIWSAPFSSFGWICSVTLKSNANREKAVLKSYARLRVFNGDAGGLGN